VPSFWGAASFTYSPYLLKHEDYSPFYDISTHSCKTVGSEKRVKKDTTPTLECPFCREPRPIRSHSNADLKKDLCEHWKVCPELKRQPGTLRKTLENKCTTELERMFPDGAAGRALPVIVLETRVPTYLLTVFRQSRYALKKRNCESINADETRVILVITFICLASLRQDIENGCMGRIRQVLESFQSNNANLIGSARLEGCRVLADTPPKYGIDAQFILKLDRTQDLKPQCLRVLADAKVEGQSLLQRLGAREYEITRLEDKHAASSCTAYEIRIPLRPMNKALGVIEKVWRDGPSVVIAHHVSTTVDDIVVPVVKACLRNADVKELMEVSENRAYLTEVIHPQFCKRRA